MHVLEVLNLNILNIYKRRENNKDNLNIFHTIVTIIKTQETFFKPVTLASLDTN